MPKKRRKLKSFVYLLHNKRGTTKNTTFFNLNHFLIAIKRKNPFDVISRGFLYSLLKIISGASPNKYSPIIYDFGMWETNNRITGEYPSSKTVFNTTW